MMQCDEAAYAAGVRAAQTDIAANCLEYRWSGHASHWGHWIAVQLAERFGVSVNDGFGVCCVTSSSLSFNDGYNEELASEIDRRHGSGVFKAVFTESRQQSEESLWAAKRLWLEQHSEETGVPKAGRYAGRLTVPDDFDEPLEELREYME